MIDLPEARLCNQSAIKHLEGKLLTVIEGIGLPTKQEEAIKSQVRNHIWGTWSDDMAWIPPKLAEEMFKVRVERIEGEKLLDSSDVIETVKY